LLPFKEYNSSEPSFGVYENTQRMLDIFNSGQENWLSELYKEREYIKSSIQVLQELVI